MQKHDRYIYFDPIRTNSIHCKKSVVSLRELESDLVNNQLPNFAFIMPNLCNSAHGCSLHAADQWLKQIVDQLLGSPVLG